MAPHLPVIVTSIVRAHPCLSCESNATPLQIDFAFSIASSSSSRYQEPEFYRRLPRTTAFLPRDLRKLTYNVDRRIPFNDKTNSVAGSTTQLEGGVESFLRPSDFEVPWLIPRSSKANKPCRAWMLSFSHCQGGLVVTKYVTAGRQ
jgi:hypothetical protein